MPIFAPSFANFVDETEQMKSCFLTWFHLKQSTQFQVV